MPPQPVSSVGGWGWRKRQWTQSLLGVEKLKVSAEDDQMWVMWWSVLLVLPMKQRNTAAVCVSAARAGPECLWLNCLVTVSGCECIAERVWGGKGLGARVQENLQRLTHNFKRPIPRKILFFFLNFHEYYISSFRIKRNAKAVFSSVYASLNIP